MNIKKLFKRISIILLLVMFFPYISIITIVPVVEAATVEEVGAAIASFAIDYYNKVQVGEVPYTCHPYNFGYNTVTAMAPHRAINKDTGLPPLRDGKYYMIDCVGWVNFCVFGATGIEYWEVTSGAGGYAVPKTRSKRHCKF